MSVCLCGLLVAALSAGSADLDTTAQFTAKGGPEMNPLARPFVEGRGAKGEVTLGVLNAGAFLLVDQRAPEPWRSLTLGGAFAVHTWLATRNVRVSSAETVPPIVFPVLIVRW